MVNLGDIAEFKNGKALSKDRYLTSGQWPVFGSNGEIARTNDILNNNRVISIGRVGAYCGAVYAIRTKSWVTDNAIIAEPKNGNDFDFLYYLLSTLQLNRTAIGSAQPLLTQNGLKLIPISKIPPKEQQKKIGNTLRLLDDKIDLNNQMNETLESMAKAIFKEWFIDFGPVRAKAEGRRPFGMDDETAALFPDSFEDSELGPIPKGWRVGVVENNFNLTIGRTPPRKESQWFSNSENNTKWVSIKDMGNSRVFISNTSEFLTQQAIKKFKIPIVDSNVVILSFKLTLGRISITTEPMVTNEAIAHFTPKKNSFLKLPYYAYCYLSSFNYEKLGSTSSIATAINSTLLKSIKFLIPNDEVLISFNKLVESTFKQIQNNQLENNNLIKIQNLLLPKLISGEISLSNKEISPISNETTTHIPVQQKIYAYAKNEEKLNV